ncbi:uncharacterized protein HMPREF1541_07307 [Cyphellophora europaea CBS 101466]|uniref:Uncharacterized protein n=1 Tax=Cyphellophora europaea (strain CBS 101466) TaxID=1220924 RepID=W2RPM6_CYPE1|nr:uncharacterized protein HMPREF1541_07307 [Cyphellophora europaea CBS 101466]ETN37684.1 hypothetical protein HMPREF1541_07307 [Cyphellophora europaea CBS 101466]
MAPDPFDTQRLYKTYAVNSPNAAMEFQEMVEDFMEIVRNEEEWIATGNNIIHVDAFIVLVRGKEMWPLAKLVIPEFQETQAFDTETNTAVNYVLRAVFDKRPAIPIYDPKLLEEEKFVRRHLCHTVEYLATLGMGEDGLSKEEKQALGVLSKLIEKVIDPDKEVDDQQRQRTAGPSGGAQAGDDDEEEQQEA